MKTKSAIEAQHEIIEIIRSFRHMAEHQTCRMSATIENVGFSDFISLYKTIITPKKRLFMPGEIDNENMTFIYTPAPGCTIVVESEPCVKLWPRINLINAN